MYDIRDHVLTGMKFSSKEYILTCKEGSFVVPDAELLIYRKQELQWMRVQHIGDGMKVMLTYPVRDLGNLSVKAIEAGLSIYQEYDEQQDTWATYLYKYAGGDPGREKINTFFSRSGSTTSVMVEQGFTRLLGVSPFKEDLLHTYTTFTDQIAVMAGICLGYGKPKQISNGRILSWHVGLPLVGSVVTYYPMLEKLRDTLGNQGVFTVRSMQGQKVGSMVQLTIHDVQLIDILEEIRIGTSTTFLRNEQLTNKVSAFLGDNNGILHNSLLKFVSK